MKNQNDVLRRRRPRCQLRHISGSDLSKWSDITLHSCAHPFEHCPALLGVKTTVRLTANVRMLCRLQSSPSGKPAVFAYKQPQDGLPTIFRQSRQNTTSAAILCKDGEPSLFGNGSQQTAENRRPIVLSSAQSTQITSSLLIRLPPFSLMAVWEILFHGRG